MGAVAGRGLGVAEVRGPAPPNRPSLSLAAYSLHRAFAAGEVDAGAMITTASEMGFSALELVTTFLPLPRRDRSWSLDLERLRRQGEDLQTPLALIMCEGIGDIGAPRVDRRLRAVDLHARWLDGAAHLDCSAVRVQLVGDPTSPQRTLERVARSLQTLLRSSSPDIALLVENHSGLTSDPSWMRSLIRRVASPRVGVLPDTGNFSEGTDVAQAIGGLLPYAGGLSAKFYEFDDHGWETTIDYPRIAEVVRLNAYEGYVGVEYEGTHLGEREGIRAGKRLLERLLA